MTNSDINDPSDKVKLMTIHAAKGLEFPYVFLCGLNEGIFPFRRIRTLAGMEEERRIAFVAMTRAEKGLFLSGANGVNHDGIPRYPSRFVMDIDKELLEYTEEVDESLVKDARAYYVYSEKSMPENLQNSMLQSGTRIRHAHFGEGTIQSADTEKGMYLIQFDSMPTPRSLMARVKLEVVS